MLSRVEHEFFIISGPGRDGLKWLGSAKLGDRWTDAKTNRRTTNNLHSDSAFIFSTKLFNKKKKKKLCPP